MNLFFLYFLSYFLTLTGYFLGKATREEHKEIRKYVTYFVELLLFMTYTIVFYVFRELLVIILLFVVVLLIKLISYKFDKFNIKGFHNVLLLGLSIIFLFQKGDIVYFSILPLMVVFFEKSFNEYGHLKEVYEFILFVIVYIIGSVLV